MTTEKILAVMAAAAGLLMGLAPLMQAARVHRRRHADDVSPAWLAVIVGGALVWAAYGVASHNLAIIVPNVAGSIAAAFTLALVLVVRRRSRRAASSGAPGADAPRHARRDRARPPQARHADGPA